MPDPSKVVIHAVGDMHPNRENPETIFALAAATLNKADLRFGQLEGSFTLKGTINQAIYPGVRINPENIKALTSVHFDVVSFASNHTLNWGEEGFFDHLERLREHGIAVVGAGKNIAEARKPAIFERNGAKIAFLAYCSVLPKGYDARKEKPGAVPIRVSTAYEQIDWQPGTPPRVLTFAHQQDLEDMREDIRKVRPLVDVVAVSMHWGIHNAPFLLAMYQKEVDYAAIDAGADIIFGHHAHILKGIDVYRGKVIFYSLGNFAFDFPMKHLKADGWADMYGYKIDPEYPTFPYHPDARRTMIAQCLIANRKIARVSFFPALINKFGQPEVLPQTDKRAHEVKEYVELCCRSQKLSTQFTWDDNEVVINA